jgi:hypothetical protein
MHVPPPPQILDRPGTIRWAVGSPAGPRSHTWSVVGHASVNGNRNLTSWRQVKVDHLRVYGSSVAAVGTRPRSRSLSR